MSRMVGQPHAIAALVQGNSKGSNRWNEAQRQNARKLQKEKQL